MNSLLPRRCFFGSLSSGLAAAALAIGLTAAAAPRWVISGNENKLDLTSGTATRVANPAPDSLSLLDFSSFPPKVQHLTNIPNTVLGPPSNIAIAPDGSLALIANSIRLDPADPTKWLPESRVHILDLQAQPPHVIGQVPTGAQPSGMSITRDGRVALVANRAEGSISVLEIRGKTVSLVNTLPVCPPTNSLSDVAIGPNGLVLASAQKAGYLAVLQLQGTQLSTNGQKLSVYGQPYRTVITPDGTLAITAGQGFGNALDADCLSIVDLTTKPIRTVAYVPIGVVPESFELSPDGRHIAAVLMNGSNLAPGDSNYGPRGSVVLLVRRGNTFVKVDEKPVGRIPEGVAFSPDGRHVVVQCHPDRNLWIFRLNGNSLKDTGQRIAVPGMPSSLRAGP